MRRDRKERDARERTLISSSWGWLVCRPLVSSSSIEKVKMKYELSLTVVQSMDHKLPASNALKMSDFSSASTAIRF